MFENKEQSRKKDPTSSYMPLYILLQIIGLILIFSVVYWTVQFRGGYGFYEAKIVFNWHPILMTVGFVYLFANAILHYRTFRNSKKHNLKYQHAIIHGCTLVLVLLAAIAALFSHLFASPPIPNLYTLHSWVGLVTVVMFVSQFMCGLAFYLFPRTSLEYREAMMPYHVFFGLFCFILAVASCVLGLSEKLIFALDKNYKLYPAEGMYGNYLSLLFVAFGGLTVYLVTKQEFKRNPKLDYEPIL